MPKPVTHSETARTGYRETAAQVDASRFWTGCLILGTRRTLWTRQERSTEHTHTPSMIPSQVRRRMSASIWMSRRSESMRTMSKLLLELSTTLLLPFAEQPRDAHDATKDEYIET